MDEERILESFKYISNLVDSAFEYKLRLEDVIYREYYTDKDVVEFKEDLSHLENILYKIKYEVGDHVEELTEHLKEE